MKGIVCALNGTVLTLVGERHCVSLNGTVLTLGIVCVLNGTVSTLVGERHCVYSQWNCVDIGW